MRGPTTGTAATAEEPGEIATSVDVEVGSRELTADGILGLDDRGPIVRVEVPEWGGHVYVRGMSGLERDRFEAGSLKGTGRNQQLNLANMRARLVAASVCNADGERLFSESDANWLGEKSAKALNRVFDVAQRLAGLSDQDIEDLAGN